MAKTVMIRLPIKSHEKIKEIAANDRRSHQATLEILLEEALARRERIAAKREQLAA